jgi:hypothetical protein
MDNSKLSLSVDPKETYLPYVGLQFAISHASDEGTRP